MSQVSTDSSDTAGQQTNLDGAMEVNRQLHTALQRKQDEISALRERNAQLKELVRQAEQLAQIINKRPPSLDKHQWEYTAVHNTQHEENYYSSMLNNTPTDQACGFPSDSGLSSQLGSASPLAGLKRCLWPYQEDDDATLSFLDEAKRRKVDGEPLQTELQQYLQDIEWDLQQSKADSKDQTEAPTSEAVNVYGVFHGLQIVRTSQSTDTDSSSVGEPMCFKTSIREHGTIRTHVLCTGTSFTSPTPSGGYRFLWIPK
ncbi:multicilin [Engraulis encrasicolus]|uniref:multicilin n=1 Tax=Engraulis encrasicolus TaxID=184585 RepID=UPI002FD50C6C